MARIFIDGFEAGDVKLWDAISGATAVAPVSGMEGSYCLAINAISNYAQKTVPTMSEYYAAFLYRSVANSAACSVIAFYNGTTILGWLRFLTAGPLRVYRGSGTSNLLATGPTVLAHNATNFIEVRFKPHGTGIFQVKLNGLLEIDFGGNTTPGATTITAIRLGYDVSTAYGYAYYDNFILDDAAWPGNTKIQGIIPTGAGQVYEVMALDVAPGGAGWAIGNTLTGVTSTESCVVAAVISTTAYIVKSRTGAFTLGEVITNGVDTADQGAAHPTFTKWTPSAGSNYQCVDEVPPSEADYISSNTIGHLDLYTAGDLAGTIGSVKCVQVQALAKTEGAPTPTNLQLAVRSGGTDYFSANKAVPSASKQLYNLWATDPATAAAWSESGVNAMEIGVKAVA